MGEEWDALKSMMQIDLKEFLNQIVKFAPFEDTHAWSAMRNQSGCWFQPTTMVALLQRVAGRASNV